MWSNILWRVSVVTCCFELANTFFNSPKTNIGNDSCFCQVCWKLGLNYLTQNEYSRIPLSHTLDNFSWSDRLRKIFFG